ncbi:MAG: signal recognition particle-docking protein FtsY [Desulfobulbaceae bacterium]|nr:signal recognition particle-docking protein FtsY [Desulfobulbaceae bacterium]
MLGWFKKKFSKKEQEEVSEQVLPDEVVEEQAVEEETVPVLPPEPEEDTLSAEIPVEDEVVAEPAAVEEEEEADVVPPAPAEEAEVEELVEDESVPTDKSVDEQPQAEEPLEQSPGKSLFQRLQERLGKTRHGLLHRLDSIFLGKKQIDEELLDELEEVLITSDLGVATTRELLDTARTRVKRNELSDPHALKGVLREKILSFLKQSDQAAELVMPDSGSFVIMVVGVNGVGKTTTIGKVANKFKQSGQSVLLIAADTFRAAAIDQLKIWGERVGVEVVAGEPGSDPSSVVYDGLSYGVSNDFDVIMIDTAGRLHTSVNLMEELKKIKRVISKKFAGAPHEVLLVLDATTGQNGIAQAKLFYETVGVSGLALTKLDGTAKGGIVANICRELSIPVRFIGIGEQMDDLRDFNAEEFVDALFADENNEPA